MRLAMAILCSLTLAACASGPRAIPAPPVSTPPPRPGVAVPTAPSTPPPPPAHGFHIPQIMQGPGLSGVIREPAPSLIRQFGPPRLNVAEGDMRKLQFTAEACVMDIFLYPLQPDAEPVATWVETRRASDGAEVDRLSCITALRLPGR